MRLYGGIKFDEDFCTVVLIDDHDRKIFRETYPSDLNLILEKIGTYLPSIEGFAIHSVADRSDFVQGLTNKGYPVYLADISFNNEHQTSIRTREKVCDSRFLAHIFRILTLRQQNSQQTASTVPSSERRKFN